MKHFKWKPPGKRRLHEKPNAREIEACLPWLAAEMDVVKPRILVLLGVTAAQALLGKQFRVTKERGVWLNSEMAEKVLATVHPSSILRAPDPQIRELQYAEFVDDLRTVAAELNAGRPGLVHDGSNSVSAVCEDLRGSTKFSIVNSKFSIDLQYRSENQFTIEN